ncbi:MAG: glycosyltransferase family 4 protein [Alphaproteobacteria bacterium]|nr:glycosyltransferase family 4 protein [Alphaproteobacteria bacterium]
MAMRILMHHFASLDALGGTETAIRQIASGLRGRGHHVALAEMAPHGGRREDGAGETIHCIPAARYPSLRSPRGLAANCRAGLALLRALHATQSDILHVHLPLGQCVPALIARAVRPRTRLVVTLHGPEVNLSPQLDPNVAAWQGRLLARADATVAVAADLAFAAAAAYPEVPSVGVIHNGVETAMFNTCPADLPRSDLLYVGRLSREKGVSVLLQAWAAALRAPDLSADARLVIAGDGPDRAALEAEARSAGIAGRVRFLGRVPRERLPRLYRRAVAVVLPSFTEALPLSLIEAAACGAPAIATAVGGTPEFVVHGETGILVPAGDPASLRAAIARVIGAPALAAALGRMAALRAARRFSIGATVGAYEALYASLGAGKPAARALASTRLAHRQGAAGSALA